MVGHMRYRQLGSSGLLVSVVGLGCNNFGGRTDPEASRRVIDAAVDVGITLFDTADIYGGRGRSEEILGEALAGRRDSVVLATKFGYQPEDMGYGPAAGAKGSRGYVRRAVDASLRRLRTDHIDLYYLHSPDPVTPIEETLAALHELVLEGKVRYIGTSNHAAWQIAAAAHTAREAGTTPFIAAQHHWSLLERAVEAEIVPAAAHYGVGVIPYFPLAQGLLTGKVRRGTEPAAWTRLATRAHLITDERLDKVEALEKWGAEHGRGLLEIAIGWLAAQPTVASVIAGATKPEQVVANAAAGEWEPTAEEVGEIAALASSP
jgi:aryl-alcohol dehydrogenase-like predicted oxidoreductase